MKETFAGEAVYKSMISTLDFLGLPDQSGRIAGVKVVSDMSLMSPSELQQIAVDDRIRGVLHSESSSKGKGKGKCKARTTMFDHLRLVQLLPRPQRIIVGGAS